MIKFRWNFDKIRNHSDNEDTKFNFSTSNLDHYFDQITHPTPNRPNPNLGAKLEGKTEKTPPRGRGREGDHMGSNDVDYDNDYESGYSEYDDYDQPNQNMNKSPNLMTLLSPKKNNMRSKSLFLHPFLAA